LQESSSQEAPSRSSWSTSGGEWTQRLASNGKLAVALVGLAWLGCGDRAVALAAHAAGSAGSILVALLALHISTDRSFAAGRRVICWCSALRLCCLLRAGWRSFE
jgi:hypothetical protein